MTHELIEIIQAHQHAKELGLKSVLATVVALNGSSYRRPGVRMLILDNEQMIGAVSGGCVEKEVLRQATSVFRDGLPKVMTYDGRYRLGCEGMLYILIEPFAPSEALLASFTGTIRERIPLEISSFFTKNEGTNQYFGSVIRLGDQEYPFKTGAEPDTGLEKFQQTLAPCFKLVIVGAEHDAVQLCAFAGKLGWEVSVIAHPGEEKKLKDFPGAKALLGVAAEEMDFSKIDQHTAIILMTHSYVKDLQFLIALQHSRPKYLGLLGPNKRREKLLNEFLERCPNIEDTFFDHVYGPAGLNIGGETPQEIAIAILSEILSVIRGKVPMPLREKKGGIHN